MNEARHPPLAQPPAHPTTQSPARIVAQILVDCVLRNHFGVDLDEKASKNPKTPQKHWTFAPNGASIAQNTDCKTRPIAGKPEGAPDNERDQHR